MWSYFPALGYFMRLSGYFLAFLNSEMLDKIATDFWSEKFTSPCGGMFAHPCAERP
jgi:hypothetical protein